MLLPGQALPFPMDRGPARANRLSVPTPGLDSPAGSRDQCGLFCSHITERCHALHQTEGNWPGASRRRTAQIRTEVQRRHACTAPRGRVPTRLTALDSLSWQECPLLRRLLLPLFGNDAEAPLLPDNTCPLRLGPIAPPGWPLGSDCQTAWWGCAGVDQRHAGWCSWTWDGPLAAAGDLQGRQTGLNTQHGDAGHTQEGGESDGRTKEGRKASGREGGGRRGGTCILQSLCSHAHVAQGAWRSWGGGGG